MLCRADISELWEMRDDSKAVMVAKHNYESKAKKKYVGTGLETINVSYPRKNWSSVILWNCGHPSNRLLTPEYVMSSPGRKLHRFEHLMDYEIGDIPLVWNWLAEEYPVNEEAKLVHYTLGVPAMKEYAKSQNADEWFDTVMQANHIEQ